MKDYFDDNRDMRFLTSENSVSTVGNLCCVIFIAARAWIPPNSWIRGSAPHGASIVINPCARSLCNFSMDANIYYFSFLGLRGPWMRMKN